MCYNYCKCSCGLSLFTEIAALWVFFLCNIVDMFIGSYVYDFENKNAVIYKMYDILPLQI